MNRDHQVFIANVVLACAAVVAWLAPKVAYGLQVDPASANATIGDPILDRITRPVIVKPIAGLSPQPSKDQIALQADITNLKETINRFNASSARQTQASVLQKRQAASAAWVLGLLYANGVGVDADFSEALLRFKQAHQLGEPLAAAGLAWCDIQGCQILPSAQSARVWIAQLRSTKPGRAVYLEWLVEQTFSPLQANSFQSSANIDKLALQRRQLLLNGAKMQDVQALIELGFDAIASERSKEAYIYFTSAAPYSAAASQNATLIQARQIEQQVNCKIKGDADLPDAVLLNTAQALHRGSGCQVNYVEAIRLYNLAANKGNVAAKRMLSLIYSKPDASGSINIAWMLQLANFNTENLTLSVNASNLAPMLKRDPTPLFDLIPQNLRALNSQN